MKMFKLFSFVRNFSTLSELQRFYEFIETPFLPQIYEFPSNLGVERDVVSLQQEKHAYSVFYDDTKTDPKCRGYQRHEALYLGWAY